MSSFSRWLAIAVLSAIVSTQTSSIRAQSDADRINAQKYLQVLLRRPRLGVALDRVYGYHVQNDSLDELENELLGEESSDDRGSREMVWGLVQLTRGRGAEAAEALAKAEEKLPNDAACSFYLGRALLAVGQTESAAAAMERAIERGPSRAEALPMFTELGRIYSRAGDQESRSPFGRGWKNYFLVIPKSVAKLHEHSPMRATSKKHSVAMKNSPSHHDVRTRRSRSPSKLPKCVGKSVSPKRRSRNWRRFSLVCVRVVGSTVTYRDGSKPAF
ncbi:MAG: tetratricopeptide repeat protein [Planctomycetota bacterium]